MKIKLFFTFIFISLIAHADDSDTIKALLQNPGKNLVEQEAVGQRIVNAVGYPQGLDILQNYSGSGLPYAIEARSAAGFAIAKYRIRNAQNIPAEIFGMLEIHGQANINLEIHKAAVFELERILLTPGPQRDEFCRFVMDQENVEGGAVVVESFLRETQFPGPSEQLTVERVRDVLKVLAEIWSREQVIATLKYVINTQETKQLGRTAAAMAYVELVEAEKGSMEVFEMATRKDSAEVRRGRGAEAWTVVRFSWAGDELTRAAKFRLIDEMNKSDSFRAEFIASLNAGQKLAIAQAFVIAAGDPNHTEADLTQITFAIRSLGAEVCARIGEIYEGGNQGSLFVDQGAVIREALAPALAPRRIKWHHVAAIGLSCLLRLSTQL